MNKKIASVGALAFALTFLMTGTTFAKEGSHGKKGKCSHATCWNKSSKIDLEKKVLYKLEFAAKNRDELELSGDQYEKIRDLKNATKKDLIRNNAEIDILVIDIKSKLWEDPIDQKSLNELIDQKYAIKGNKTKALVGSLAEFKNILSDKQKEKLKNLIHSKSKN
jgi:hypothetical protein